MKPTIRKTLLGLLLVISVFACGCAAGVSGEDPEDDIARDAAVADGEEGDEVDGGTGTIEHPPDGGGGSDQPACPANVPERGEVCEHSGTCTYLITPDGSPAYTLTVDCSGNVWRYPAAATCGPLPESASCDPVGRWEIVNEQMPQSDCDDTFGTNHVLEITRSGEGTLLAWYASCTGAVLSEHGGIEKICATTALDASLGEDGCELRLTIQTHEYWGELCDSSATLVLDFSRTPVTGELSYSADGMFCCGSGTAAVTATAANPD